MTYQNDMDNFEDYRWQILRQKVLTRDKNECAFCGSEEKLQVCRLRKEWNKAPWSYNVPELATFCRECVKEFLFIDDRSLIQRLGNFKWISSHSQRILIIRVDNSAAYIPFQVEFFDFNPSDDTYTCIAVDENNNLKDGYIYRKMFLDAPLMISSLNPNPRNDWAIMLENLGVNREEYLAMPPFTQE